MPDETERAIEKLLRAYAKGRRPPTPLDLDPATRRLFQAEVARVFQHESRRSGTGLLSWLLSLSFGPKLAWSAGVFLVIAVTTWSIWYYKPSHRESLLARNDKTTQRTLSTPAPQIAPPAAAPASSEARPAENAPPVSRDLAEAVQVQTSSAPEIASALSARREEQQKKDAGTSAKSVVRLSEPAGNTGARMSDSLAASGMPAFEQSFTSMPTRLFFEEPPAKAQLLEKEQHQPVLASFQWEQSGSNIRVVDQDGSVYAGSWQTSPSQLSRVEQKRSLSLRTQAVDAKLNPIAPELFFRVSGTNRSLQRLITFSGRFFPATNSVYTISTNALIDATVRSFEGTIPRLPVSQISGTAVIGATQQITINAVSAKP